MNKEQLFEDIRTLTANIKTLATKGTYKNDTPEFSLKLKSVYTHIYGSIELQLHCHTCVLQYLNNLLVWYEREYPLYLKSIEESKATESGTREDAPKKKTRKR